MLLVSQVVTKTVSHTVSLESLWKIKLLSTPLDGGVEGPPIFFNILLSSSHTNDLLTRLHGIPTIAISYVGLVNSSA